MNLEALRTLDFLEQTMAKPKISSDTVKVSRLGCMRKSTFVKTDDANTVEHVEVWVPEDGKQPNTKSTRKGSRKMAEDSPPHD